MASVLLAAEDAGLAVRPIILKDSIRGYFTEIDRTRVIVDPSRDLSEDTRRRLRRANGPVFCFIGGIKHMSMGIRRHPQPFDFVLPESPDLPLEQGAEIIPASALREMLRAATQPYLTILQMIAELAPGPVYQFEPPPPVPDSWLWEKIRWRQQRGRDEPGELPARLVRFKLWRLNTLIMSEFTEELRIRFVPHPPEAVDSEGFLLPDLVSNGTHANQAYGALILDQLTSLEPELRR